MTQTMSRHTNRSGTARCGVRGERLPREFFARKAVAVARDLLGCRLVRELPAGPRIGRIVETEAYDGPGDRASHASRGRTPRNEVMFGPPGFTYVYLVYGIHHCLNLVTGPAGYPAAVLIRALEPVAGIERSTQGPGRLCRALDIDRTCDRLDVASGPLFVLPRDGPRPRIASTPRIGVDYAGAHARKPWRFLVVGGSWVSKRPHR